MERVSVRDGRTPIVMFAPHGFQGNDENTSLIADTVANQIKSYSVVNKGWERSANVDANNDKADCNNVYHCHEDVVKEEILDPLMRTVKKAKKWGETVFLYTIHGMSDRHRIISGEKIDMVVGYGAGDPESHSMDIWRKNFFMQKMRDLGVNVFEGKSGGNMSGWSKSNMNQLYRKWYPDQSVQSLQIEIVHELRSDFDMSVLISDYIATCALETMNASSFTATESFKSY